MNKYIQVVFVIAVTAILAHARAQSDTAFTYQGELAEAGSPADGSFDFQFGLWDAVSGGTQIGTMLTHNGVAVADGLFTVELDFGTVAFGNGARWLEIVVNGTTLTPRTQITGSPYSVQTRGIYVDDAGRVGIGTTNPQADLAIESGGASFDLVTTDSSPVTSSTIRLKSVDAYGINTQLGSLSFVGEDDTVWASVSGSHAASTTGSMFLRVNPATYAQLRIMTSGIEVTGDLKIRESTGLLEQSAFISSSGADSYMQALGGDLGIGMTSPRYRLDVLANGGTPAIRANGSADASLAGGGLLLLGDTVARNIVADQDEIQARYDGAESTLYLNPAGGPVRMGPDGISAPISYGKVAADGTVTSPNLRAGSYPGWYHIDNALGWSLQETDIVIATAEGGVPWKVSIVEYEINGSNVIFNTGAIGNDSLGRMDWSPVDRPFSFVIYRP
ncbi:MAG: hypothetical protein H6810_03910 [Phycisphaeraceae bacterium]|nr:MAG: hypothetical protein H6810_03910 [Phycisphaeraceae bacterium]